jgi:hypothetical protein
MPALLLGFDIWYDRLQGLLKISHATAINKFAHKHGLDSISSSEVPCSQELQKAMKAFVQVCEHAGGSGGVRGNRRSVPHVSGCDGALGADFDAAVEGNDADSVEVYVKTDKTSLSVGNNDGQVLHVHGARGHLLDAHGE